MLHASFDLIEPNQETGANFPSPRLPQTGGKSVIDPERGNRTGDRRQPVMGTYIRSGDGATMVEVAPGQYVNAQVLRHQGRFAAARLRRSRVRSG
jgi:hypothetical protein